MKYRQELIGAGIVLAVIGFGALCFWAGVSYGKRHADLPEMMNTQGGLYGYPGGRGSVRGMLQQ